MRLCLKKKKGKKEGHYGSIAVRKQNIVGNEIREVGRGQISQGLVGHVKDFGFCLRVVVSHGRGLNGEVILSDSCCKGTVRERK